MVVRDDTSYAPVASIEGWVVIASNIHEEATEEDATDFFSEFGEVRNLHLNLDRRTGYAKGYALIEYSEKTEADRAVSEGTGQKFLDKTIKVDYVFLEASDDASFGSANRERSKSPSRP